MTRERVASAAAPVMLGISIDALAYLVLGRAAGHPHLPGGLFERIFLGLELLWITVAALTIATGVNRIRGTV
jgi:hypothetical protein